MLCPLLRGQGSMALPPGGSRLVIHRDYRTDAGHRAASALAALASDPARVTTVSVLHGHRCTPLDSIRAQTTTPQTWLTSFASRGLEVRALLAPPSIYPSQSRPDWLNWTGRLHSGRFLSD